MSITDNPATHDSRWCSWFALAATGTAWGQHPLFSLSLVKQSFRKQSWRCPSVLALLSLLKAPNRHVHQPLTRPSRRCRGEVCIQAAGQLFHGSLQPGEVPMQKKAEASRKPTQGLAVSGAGVAARRGPRHALQKHQLLWSARPALTALPSPSQLGPVHTLEKRNKARFLVCHVLFAGSVKPVKMGLGNTRPLQAQRIAGRDRAFPLVLGEVAALALSFGQPRV